MIRYKIIELSTVTDEEIEKAVNQWTGEGWNFEGVQFAMREASKRPSMAFVFFTKEVNESEAAVQAGQTEQAEEAAKAQLPIREKESAIKG